MQNNCEKSKFLISGYLHGELNDADKEIAITHMNVRIAPSITKN